MLGESSGFFKIWDFYRLLCPTNRNTRTVKGVAAKLVFIFRWIGGHSGSSADKTRNFDAYNQYVTSTVPHRGRL